MKYVYVFVFLVLAGLFARGLYNLTEGPKHPSGQVMR